MKTMFTSTSIQNVDSNLNLSPARLRSERGSGFIMDAEKMKP